MKPLTTEQYSERYIGQVKANIGTVFAWRNSGEGSAKRVGFRYAREMIQTQVRHIRRARHVLANPFAN
jgi:hypothetical protein